MRNLRPGRIAVFLLLTFALSSGFHLLVAATVGGSAYLETGLSPLDMLLPASVALVLRLFVYKDSPIPIRRFQSKPGWLLYDFLMLTLVCGAVTLTALWDPGPSAVLLGLGSLLPTLWTLLVLFVAGQSSKEQLERAGLQLEDTDWGARLVLGVVVFFAAQAGLNLLFGLGAFRGPSSGSTGCRCQTARTPWP